MIEETENENSYCALDVGQLRSHFRGSSDSGYHRYRQNEEGFEKEAQQEEGRGRRFFDCRADQVIGAHSYFPDRQPGGLAFLPG
jgi:hypothetical protein